MKLKRESSHNSQMSSSTRLRSKETRSYSKTPTSSRITSAMTYSTRLSNLSERFVACRSSLSSRKVTGMITNTSTSFRKAPLSSSSKQKADLSRVTHLQNCAALPLIPPSYLGRDEMPEDSEHWSVFRGARFLHRTSSNDECAIEGILHASHDQSQ